MWEYIPVEVHVFIGLMDMYILSHCIIPAGNIVISDNVVLTVDSDLNGPSPQFTLTCISTGGPATTVSWTRDSQTVIGNRKTVLVDGETAQYTHTLTVTGSLGGLYTCTVANSKPSNDSASFTVQGNCIIDSYKQS